jgi:hypothetical protein
MASPNRSRTPAASSVKLLVPCAQCGATVLRGVWQDAIVEQGEVVREAGMQAYTPPVTPVTGEAHVCTHNQESAMPL